MAISKFKCLLVLEQTRVAQMVQLSTAGAESSGTMNPPDTDTKTSKQKQAQFTPAGALFIQEKVSSGNSNENAKMGDTTQAENDVSKEDNRAVAVDVAMSSTPMTENGGRSNLGSRKSKKRMNSSLPQRTSKRLAGSEPEIQSNLDLNERSLRAAVRGSTVSEVDTSPNFPLEASDIPQTSNIEPPKEATDHTVISEETLQDDDQLKEVEKPPADIPQTSNIKPPKEPTDHTVRNEETLLDINQLKEVEKPSTEGSPIPEEQSVAKESNDKQLCYDFGESWSDPLEFALKTLRGEIPIDDTLTFPSFFGDGCSKQSDFDVPINFQSKFVPNSESLKKNNAVDSSPATSSPSFSTLGNIGFNSCVGLNFQPSSEVGKKDPQSQTKFNP